MGAQKPKARSGLLSMVLQRYATQREQFLPQCQTPWLVWERGPWKPPAADGQTMSLPNFREIDALDKGTDLLCFHLLPIAGEASVFRVGREPGNEVIINDATVSRRHLELHCGADSRWSVTELASGARRPLPSRSLLQVGAVKVTFLEPKEWLARLDAELVAAAAKK